MSRTASGALYFDRSPRVRARRARPARHAGAQQAQPAFALAALFAVYYLLGTVIANWQLALAIVLPAALAIWLFVVLADVFDLPVVDRWRLRRERWRLRREIRQRRGAGHR